MSSLAIRVLPEEVRILDNGGITGAYAGIGASFAHPVHWFLLQNLTNELLMFSWDGIKDHFPLPSNGYVIMDVASNKTIMGGAFMIAQGTRFYARTLAGNPVSGAVYLSIFYGANG